MVLGIPTTIACIKPSHRGDFVVDNAELFMVTEVVHQLACSQLLNRAVELDARELTTRVIWVPHASDVLMQTLESMLCVLGRKRHRSRYFLVHHHVDPHPFLRFTL
jgi:hypothetical protein